VQVLTVARWYPSHDSPGRGSFVADLVHATGDAGVDARVVSFDRVVVTGRANRREAVRAAARAAYDEIVTPESLFVVPRSRGAAGVPVARVPLVRPPGTSDIADLIEGHEDALRPVVRSLSEEWRPDVIHAHTGLPDGIAAARIGRELGIPVVVTEHASTIETVLSDPVAHERYHTLLEPDVRLLAVSPATAQRLAVLLGVGTARIGVIANPIFDSAFRMADPAARHPGELLYIGSLGEHKEIDVLLRAHALLLRDRPALRLRLIGPERKAGDRARWEALAAQLGITAAVDFDGWADREQVAAAMARASVLVHPSPSETFGVVAAEAIFSGLPVAARQSGGVPWVIDLSGGYGAVADGDGAAAFASAIRTVLDGSLTVDAASARARLVDSVGATAVASQMLKLYRSLAPGAATSDPTPRGAAAQAAPAGARAVPTVLAARDRRNGMQLVSALPADLRNRLVLVVPRAASGTTADGSSDAVSSVRLAEAGAVPRRRPRPKGRGPLQRLRRALWRPQPTANDVLAEAILAAASTVQVGIEPVEIVALDAQAAVLVARLDPTRVCLAPGTLRWLADLWDAEPGERTSTRLEDEMSRP
jgi:D-inositol-3-phosphate glycosyltransferase